MRVSLVASIVANEINEPISVVSKAMKSLNKWLGGQLYRWIKAMS